MPRNAIRNTILLSLAVLFVCTVCLPTYAQTTSITGVAKDVGGVAVVGASITATNKTTGQQFSAQTNSEGRYTISNVTPGIYKVVLEASHFAKTVVENVHVGIGNSSSVDFTLGDTQIVHGSIQISNPRPGTIKGTVKNQSNGRSIRNAEVRIQEQGGINTNVTVRTDGAGKFSKSHLPSNTYKVSVKARGFEESEQTVELGDGQVKTLAFKCVRSNARIYLDLPAEVFGHE